MISSISSVKFKAPSHKIMNPVIRARTSDLFVVTERVMNVGTDAKVELDDVKIAHCTDAMTLLFRAIRHRFSTSAWPKFIKVGMDRGKGRLLFTMEVCFEDGFKSSVDKVFVLAI